MLITQLFDTFKNIQNIYKTSSRIMFHFAPQSFNSKLKIFPHFSSGVEPNFLDIYQYSSQVNFHCFPQFSHTYFNKFFLVGANQKMLPKSETGCRCKEGCCCCCCCLQMSKSKSRNKVDLELGLKEGKEGGCKAEGEGGTGETCSCCWCCCCCCRSR